MAALRNRAVVAARSPKEKSVEKIQEKSIAAANHVAHVFAHQRAEYDGPNALLSAHQIDLADRLDRLVNRGDKWHSHLPKLNAVELCHEAVTHCFRCNAGLIGYEKYSSFNHGNLIESALAP